MNVFMCNPEERLDQWATLRDQLAAIDKTEALRITLQFWYQAPYSKNVIHPRDSSRWPTIWEMINDGEFCHNSIAYCIAMTFVLSDLKADKISLMMGRNKDDGSEGFSVAVDDVVVGALYGEIIPKDEYSEHIDLMYSYTWNRSYRKFETDRNNGEK